MKEPNPYSAPETDLVGQFVEEGSVWRVGDIIVMDKRATLPSRWVRCNEPTSLRLKRNLSWHPQAWFLVLFLLGPIIYVIVAMIVRHTAKVYVPICARHRSRRRKAIAIGWLVALVGFFILPIAGAVNGSIPAELVVAVGVITIIAGLIVGIVGSKLVSPDRIDKQLVWLKGADTSFLDELPISPV